MKIAEDYGTFEAPVWVRHVVERLTASVPPGQLRGLSSVRSKLQHDYMRATYWYLRPVAPILRWQP